jgi:hypothetical protein
MNQLRQRVFNAFTFGSTEELAVALELVHHLSTGTKQMSRRDHHFHAGSRTVCRIPSHYPTMALRRK